MYVKYSPKKHKNKSKITKKFKMSANILYVSSQVDNYTENSVVGEMSRFLPQQIQEAGMQVRIFMPRYGLINERRGQLHEVIRLSGMNLIIAQTDHQLIIKVASITGARLQVYFIDNTEFFSRKQLFTNDEGELLEDNDQRALFFSRGTIETVKKLRWAPNIVHTNGWISALTPIYIRKVYKNDPIFSKAKVVVSLYNDDFEGKLDDTLMAKLKKESIKLTELGIIEEPTYVNLMKLALSNADGIVVVGDDVNPELIAYAKELGVPMLESPTSVKEDLAALYKPFYEQILGE